MQSAASGSGTIAEDHRLDGWKAIANFLGRERTTAIRWANERGLPVHRVPGGQTGTVFAIQSELEAWLQSDLSHIAKPFTPDTEADYHTPLKSRRSLLLAMMVGSTTVLFALGVMWLRASRRIDAPVSISAIASANANPDTLEFALGLDADLARFANATPTLAIFEYEPSAKAQTQYAVRTEIERAGDKMIANARLISVDRGQVVWSRRFEQTIPELSVLRERVAANIVGQLRCSFGLLESERPKAKPADIEQLMAICASFQEGDLVSAQARARQLTRAHPDLALGWAMLAIIDAEMAADGGLSLGKEALESSNAAERLAPHNVSTWHARAAVIGNGPTSPQALPTIDRALAEHPDVPSLLNNRSVILFNLGYVRDSAEDALNALRNDPSSFSGRGIAVRRLAAAGRNEEALKLQSENERLWPGHPEVAANRDQILSSAPAQRSADVAAIAKLKLEFATHPYVAYMLARLFERGGNRPAALSWLARAPINNTAQQYSLLFWPDAAGLRTEPAFFRKMADLKLVSWWVGRKKWPDFCAEPGLNYNCTYEAKKLRISTE